MVYKVLGMMSGSSLDGLDVVFAQLEESAGKWTFEILQTHCYEYDLTRKTQLRDSVSLKAFDYQLLNTSFGHFLGAKCLQFIKEYNLEHQIHFIACHGHTTFHYPEKQMTHQLGDGAAIAAETKLPVITDLRSLDVALGGQGAPLVPIGEKLLFSDFSIFLNIGGIANISFGSGDSIIGYDICPANKVLNMIAEEAGQIFDRDGQLASRGEVHSPLLIQLNNLSYYQSGYPKSLNNSFGIDDIYPLIKSFKLKEEDSMATYVAHMVQQIFNACKLHADKKITEQKIFLSGGGALNSFLVAKLSEGLKKLGIEIFLPSQEIINFKEALIVALIGTLRWREQTNTLSSVTGAVRDSIGGALWLGGEA